MKNTAAFASLSAVASSSVSVVLTHNDGQLTFALVLVAITAIAMPTSFVLLYLLLSAADRKDLCKLIRAWRGR